MRFELSPGDLMSKAEAKVSFEEEVTSEQNPCLANEGGRVFHLEDAAELRLGERERTGPAAGMRSHYDFGGPCG